MKIELAISEMVEADTAALTALAHRAERAGIDGITTSESRHDPFLPLAVVAAASPSLQVATGIAVAFARNPMTVAVAGDDLQRYSRGRMTLGLGTQVRTHIRRRYGMPWSAPAARMREFVLAMRSIWDAWAEDAPLSFRGEFYSHTLMPPFFRPGPNPWGAPPVALGGVGPRMAAVAGEVADVFVAHPLCTERYFDDVLRPAISAGRRAAGHLDTTLPVAMPVLVASATTREGLRATERVVRQRLAFYAATPTYRGVLATHGLEDMQLELNRMARAGRWDAMGDVIDDDVAELFVVAGHPVEAGRRLWDRAKRIADRLSLYLPYDPDRGVLEGLVTGARAAASEAPVAPTTPAGTTPEVVA